MYHEYLVGFECYKRRITDMKNTFSTKLMNQKFTNDVCKAQPNISEVYSAKTIVIFNIE